MAGGNDPFGGSDFGSQDAPGPAGSAGSDRSGGLGEILLRSKVITPDQLQNAQEASGDDAGLTGAITKLGFVQESQLVEFLSQHYGVPSLNLQEVEIDPQVIDLIPKEVAERHHVVPVDRRGTTLVVAMSDPSNIYAMDDIKFLTGFKVEVVVASEASVSEALERYYDSSGDIDGLLEGFSDDDINFLSDDDDMDITGLEDEAGEAPVVRLVNLILVDAIKRGASDIHLEPYEKELRVRYRIDGVLYEIMKPPLRLKNALTSRIKIMSELDIAERRLPQDGRIKLVLGGNREVDFRVSVLPTLFGEKVVLRILDRSSLQLDMTKLGFEVPQLSVFKEAIAQPYGMVLVTGPTGSGKTTSLYSALSELNKTSENICTAEDPVEFNLQGINQVQVNDNIGLNFSACLRAFLRQDPDIIMVGEIRDFETAEIGVKAALTGHLVLSTLHTNDAPSTINRLLNMGVEPFLVTASLNCIVAQRLARRVCPDCAEPVEVEEDVLHGLGLTDEEIERATIIKGRGCRRCSETGYRGRIALYEVMPATDEIKEFVLQGYSALELKREAIKAGMQTLRRSAIHKVIDGVTTVEEALRVTRADR